MKVAEKLAILKQKEGELMRTYELRDAVLKQGFKDTVVLTNEESSEELEKKRQKFIEDKKKKVAEYSEKIETLKKEVIEGKNIVNKKNVETGQDIRLAEMKYLRLELSKLMGAIKKDRWLSRVDFDVDIFEELGLSKRISELETKKAKLDSEIQKYNWNTDL